MCAISACSYHLTAGADRDHRNIFTLSALGCRKFYEISKMRLECFYTSGTTISVTSATFDETWTESSIDITGPVGMNDPVYTISRCLTYLGKAAAQKRIAPKPVGTPAAVFSEHLAFVCERSCPLSLPAGPSAWTPQSFRKLTFEGMTQCGLLIKIKKVESRADPLGSQGDKSGGRIKESEYTEFAVFSQPKISQDLANVSRDNGLTVSGAPVCGTASRPEITS
ncbi:hypothetical protein B0H14DRAFT_3719950 [Mycena olivaceomarginata]|nr:hypothetical protein B0H14DRAFT_3719950 [Mycena olivaceomarginata]